VLLTHVSSFPTSTCFCLALLLLQHRDWIQDEDFPRSLGNDRTVWATEVSKQLPFLSLCFLSGCRICWSRCLGSNSGQTHAAATDRHFNSAVPDGGVVPIANAHDEPGDVYDLCFLGGGCFEWLYGSSQSVYGLAVLTNTLRPFCHLLLPLV
jgi:hypothetical protein